METINEQQEFEAINQKTSERKAAEDNEIQSIEDTCREQKAKAKAKATLFIVLTFFVVAIALVGITGLFLIGWINDIFCIVLMCLAGAVASFKTGYFWHEFKN